MKLRSKLYRSTPMVNFLFTRNIPKHHSDRRLFTGFDTAAFTVSTDMVANAMTAASTAEAGNIHHDIFVL